MITSCPARYQRSTRVNVKAVDRRASTLPREYTEKAMSIDTLYGGVPEGVVGPVQAKLHSFPPLRKWVFGAWGEASEDVQWTICPLPGPWPCNISGYIPASSGREAKMEQEK